MTSIFPYKNQADPDKSLGRLKTLGVTDHYMAPFLLPKKFNDIRKKNIIMDFTQLSEKVGEKVFVACALVGRPDVDFRSKPVKTRFQIEDRFGHRLQITYFGPSKELIESMQSKKSFCLRADVATWNNYLQLKNIEWVPTAWIGKVQPVYPGKTKSNGPGKPVTHIITPETVLNRMSNLVDAHIDKAVHHLRVKFDIQSEQDESRLINQLGGQFKSLTEIIKASHVPSTPDEGHHSHALLRRLAAKEVLEKLEESEDVTHPDSAIPISNAVLDQLIKEMPGHMRMTKDQSIATSEIIDDIRSNRPMRRLLTGDVGTGKSIPIALAAAAVARAGENAIILMPNEPLAEQMRRDIETWWPDLAPKLVSNSTSKKNGLPDSRILVGTTALNFRVPDDYPRKLLIIDEQQKMSVDQRLKLAQPDTNVLEASATPLPRSMALIKFGNLPISTLREAYVKKDIATQIVANNKPDRIALFQDIKQVISEGYQALIIYPMAELAEIGDDITPESRKKDLKSAEGAFEVWERLFPGRVRFAHGKQNSQDKLGNIAALNNNEADILCSTTVVEVGLNVSLLRYVVVVHPERLGLSTLHQIRGRLCRNGGEGKCALYLPDPVSEKSMERLKVFERLTDGFLIAHEDMRMRGMGDMISASENEQAGDIDISFLPNQRITIEDFEWATRNFSKGNSDADLSVGLN